MTSPQTTPARPVFLLVKFLAGFIALLVLLTLGMSVRLMAGPPLVLRSLTPWFEAMLSQKQYGIKAHIDQSLLVWDKERKSAVLNLTKIEFKDRLEQSTGGIAEAVIILKPLGYFDETRSPWAVTLRDIYLYARVTSSGEMMPGALGSGEAPSPARKEEKAEGFSTDTLRDLLQDLMRDPFSRTGLGFFANLKIENAGMTLIDEGQQITWNVLVPELFFKRTHDDYTGKADVKVMKNDMETLLGFSLAYTDTDKLYHASWSFDHLNPVFFTDHIDPLKTFDYIAAPLTGTISIDIARDFKVESGNLNVNLDAGEFRLPEFIPQPLPFTAGQIAARYDVKNKKLIVGPARLDLAHAILKGEAEMVTDKEPRPFSAKLTVLDVSMRDLPEYWPENAGKNARDWILTNIHEGKIKEATTNLGLNIPASGLANAQLTHLDGAIQLLNAKLTAWKALPDITKANAESTFTEKGFDIKVHGGEMNGIKIGESTLVITGLQDNEQIMMLRAPLSGPASTILEMLDHEPMHYAKKIGIDPRNSSGKAEGKLTMSFPLLKNLPFEHVDIAADVKITDASIYKMVDLLDVTGGDLALKVDKNQLMLEGTGNINGIHSSVSWLEQFSPPEGQLLSKGRFKATAEAQDAKKFGVAFELRSTAPFPLDVTYERDPVFSKLVLHGDIKEPGFEIPAVSYVKGAGSPAIFDTVLEWGGGKPMRLTSLAVKGEGVDVKGEGGFTGQSLSSLHLDPLKLGKTDAHLDYRKEADKPQSIVIKGASLDITRLLETSDEKAAPPPDATPSPLAIDMDVATLVTGGSVPLTKFFFKGERDGQGWKAIDMKGVAKDTPFTFNLTTGAGDMMRLAGSTHDFGDFLRALDVTDAVYGGKLTLEGKSRKPEDKRTLFGHIKLERYRVTNLPVLAQLLSAISPDGIAALLTGEGLTFGELTGEYYWDKNNVTIAKASTSTGSLGLTTTGKIGLNDNSIGLQGQVVPIYFISKVLSSVPVLGAILTGGEEGGGLFAATYTIIGPLSRPKISVNPVSVLAPGFLRTILFGSKPGEAPVERQAAPPVQEKEPSENNLKQE